MDEGSFCKSVDLKEDNVGDSTKFSFIRLMRMNKPEWAYVAGAVSLYNLLFSLT